MKTKSLLSFIGILLLFFTLLIGCSSSKTTNNSSEETGENLEQSNNSSGQSGSTDLKKNLIIGTSPQGSAYNTTSAGIAKVVSTTSELQVSVKPYAGPNAWMPLLNNGEIDMGISSSPDLVWGIKGENGFKEAHKNVRILAMGNYPPTNGIVVRKDSGIETTADLKGKKVAAEYAGNQIIQLLVELQLKSVGLTWDDVQPVPVASAPAGLQALQDGRVDAAMGLSPLSGQTLEADASVGGLRVLNIADVKPEDFDQFPEEVAQEISEVIPGTRPTVYQGGGILKDDAAVLYEYPVILNGSTNINDETAYEIVKTLHENYKELHPIYSWLTEWTDETMFTEYPPAPYHDGAIKYFKEKGIWTEEAEAHHQELLKLVQ